jgi:cell division protein FtsB
MASQQTGGCLMADKEKFMKAMRAIELELPEPVYAGFTATVLLYTTELEQNNERLKKRNEFLEKEVKKLRFS